MAASANGILITDSRQSDNPIIYCNAAFEKITGYGQDEIIGRNCRFLQGDDTNQQALAEVRKAIRNGQNLCVVLRNYRKDGTMFWNELSISPVRNVAGVVTHMIGIQNDITQRIKAQQALAEKEAQLVSITDALPVLISYFDKDVRYRFANQTHIEWFGRTPDELSGLLLQEVIGQDKFVAWQQHLAVAFAGNSEQYDCQLQHQSKGLRMVRVVLVPDFSSDRTVIGLHCLLTDTTDQKIIEQQATLRRDYEQQLATLTDDERIVYDRLIKGESNKSIATELDVGLRTVERRRRNILDKLNAISLTELLKRMSMIEGWL